MLTRFQERCESALSEMLRGRGESITSREVVGEDETYVHLVVGEGSLEVWLYDDEAEYQAGGRRRNFESAVFRDERDRIDSFVNALEDHLLAPRATHPWVDRIASWSLPFDVAALVVLVALGVVILIGTCV